MFDITAQAADGSVVRIQTVTTLADGTTLTPSEAAAAARIQAASQSGDRLILVPKGTSLDSISQIIAKGTQAMKRIFFYATGRDIFSVTRLVEEKMSLKYILANHDLYVPPGDDAPVYYSASSISGLGKASRPASATCERYVVAEKNVSINMITEKVKGIDKAYFSISNCADCIEFNAGGMWEDKVLLNGLIQTWSDSKLAQRLMRQFQSAFKKNNFERIAYFWVGPEAYELLRQGGRLTRGTDAASSFDLQLPA
ncbi:hypothetical protein AB4Z52_10530 [Rhizobium sp. 2YAF20]|uniref:hypothetical protein n=1 Tax=Rhizobium sp. 2YAF20 TaxID=3233027 RepID=UPI003F9EA9EA